MLSAIILLSCNKNNCNQKWYRPAEEPVFNISYGNNHDAIVLVDQNDEYPYKMIVSGWGCKSDMLSEQTFLWRAKSISWNSNDWQLIDSNFRIGCQYEYDDAILVDGVYYIYEDGLVYTYQGELEESSGKWLKAGSFPKEICDDVGVYYEDGLFHLFGEYGIYPQGPDGTSLSHLVSQSGLGDWTMVDSLAVNPNKDGSSEFGVGDASIIKKDGQYYLYCDMESEGEPYKVVIWQSTNINEAFTFCGVAAEARKHGTKNWDNNRIQDSEVFYATELKTWVMVCNMKDTDGNPGGNFPGLKNFTRVLGFFYLDTE